MKQKNTSADLVDVSKKETLLELLQKSSIKISEFISGFLAEDKNEWKLSAGHLVQAIIKNDFITQLGREIEKYRKNGEIKEDYWASNNAKASLCDLLKFVDNEVPDQEKFKALKSIFFSSISVGVNEQEEIIAYETLQIAKKMSSTEILILKANYEIAQGKFYNNFDELKLKSSSSITWTKEIANQMGHKMSEMVTVYEKHLEELGLISPRGINYKDPNPTDDYQKPDNFRLTNLGMKFCELITKYSDKK